jgi:MmeI, target recognition domain/Eco57I restriction-modification methylase
LAGGHDVRDADEKFHKEWLGLAQPIEGLVFSIPALADAQIAPRVRPSITAEFEEQLEETNRGPAVRDVRAFFEQFLGYARPGMLIAREELPDSLSFQAQEGRQTIRPTFAIARGPFDGGEDDPFARFESAGGTPVKASDAAQHSGTVSPYVALVWDLSTDAGDTALDIDLDEPEAETGPWRRSPTAKLERLLQVTGVPIGFVSNRRELRLVYSPVGESAAHLTFRFDQLAQSAGRPLVAALELIFHAHRTYGAAPEFTFEGLLRESRRRQADVTKDLADQVREAVEMLVEGFEHAASRDCVGHRTDWLRAALEERDDHFYQGILSVVLRLVFLLYAEDQSLVPVQHPVYSKHLSVFGLYDRLAVDAGAHPESMHLRFGAYGRLIALFRAVFLGVSHQDLHLPPRSGKLFDPSAFPFLEGGLPGWTAPVALAEERAAVELPSIDDETIYRVLKRLVVFKGQRLSYRTLDVEQIGAVYESLMGYHALRVTSPAVRIGSNRHWVETEPVLSMKAVDRKHLWKQVCGLSTSAQGKAEAAAKGCADAATLAERLSELAPGAKGQRDRHRAAPGRLVLQPDEERRRTGSHYTPRSLAEQVVKRTLEPILACLGEGRTAEQILSLKICDPAMGSGAFLVATCRLLGKEVVAAWDRAGELTAVIERHGNALLHACRLVAQRCLYGVDKNTAAVELAKLSLWLVTLSKELPFTFVDHALRHGDSLVGLDLEQIRSFHWKPEGQVETCRRALNDALEQALEYRERILVLAEREDAASQREKQRLLEYSEQSIARIRTIADACVGAFFAEGRNNAREKERDRRLGLVQRWLAGDESAGEDLKRLQQDVREKVPVFHWMLEFPEVFHAERPDPLDNARVNRAAYMDGFVGNPPFAGKNGISETGGENYLPWLQAIHEGAHGNADLSAHFFRRAAELIGAHGTIGLIATNTIAQGDTRASALQPLVARGFTIYDATRSMMWPGGAAVSVAVVHLAVGSPAARITTRRLDGAPVPAINSRLRGKPERADPVPLRSNEGCSFQGSIVLGMGFTLTPEERDALVAKDPRNAERIFPYLGGEEVNTSPTQSFNRYVISFGQMSLEEAERWPDLIAIVREKVKPERGKNNRANYRERWWQFGEYRPGLFEAIRGAPRCLVNSRVSKHLMFAFQPTDRVFAETLYSYPMTATAQFAVVQSRVHGPWAWLLSSSMRGDLRYAASDCFETFPFPQPDPRAVIPALEDVGQRLYEARAAYMLATEQGLTQTYNALKDPACDDARIAELRRLHEEMDRAVLEAYGWSDVEVPPYCGADAEALERFEDEVIDRLFVLNAEQAAEEKRLGVANGGKTKKAKRAAGKKRGGAGQAALALEGSERDS